jgi:cysteinyl-tRNA synthetase
LGALRPGHEPRATEYIDEMKDMIGELVRKRFAYVVPASIGHNSRAQYVYLDSTRVPSHAFLSVDSFNEHDVGYRYGELSGRSVDDMIVGSRAETGEGKRNPMDSVLWKPSTLEQPGWSSGISSARQCPENCSARSLIFMAVG